MSNDSQYGHVLALLLLSASVASEATADFPLFIAEPSRARFLGSVRGYSFTIDHDFTLTGLGKIDANENGILDDQSPSQIALWDANTEQIVAQTFIDQNSTFRDAMFVTPVTPLTLPAGRYTLAAEFFNNEEPHWTRPTFSSPVALVHDIVGLDSQESDFSLPTRISYVPLGPNLVFDVPDVLVSEPRPRSVAQRRTDGTGRIPVSGVFNDSIGASVEARAIPIGKSVSEATAWQTLETNGESFSGSVHVAAGGWYELQTRLVDAANETVHVTSTDDVGVGEVFVIAGQSNSANSGGTRLTPQSPDVVAMDQAGAWQHAADPQPIATGGGGSPWPEFGDRIAEALEVPVGIVSVGWGGTRVGQWQPGASGPDVNGPLYNRLRDALERLGPEGARAVLWHQGESDSAAGTSRELYAAQLANLIAESRADAGYPIEWGIAEAAFLPATSLAAEMEVRLGQRDVIAADSSVFAGPLTDDLIGSQWRYDAVHFNEAGLRLHGQRWAEAVLNRIRVPEPASVALVAVGLAVLCVRRDW